MLARTFTATGDLPVAEQHLRPPATLDEAGLAGDALFCTRPLQRITVFFRRPPLRSSQTPRCSTMSELDPRAGGYRDDPGPQTPG